MKASDKSIHSVSIAAIKRKTMKPYDFTWTKYYEHNDEFTNHFQGLSISLAENELIICATVIYQDNYSILTTQQLVTNEKGSICSGSLIGAKEKGPLGVGIKGFKNPEPVLGTLELADGNSIRYFIEPGRASMMVIYAVGTVLGKLRQMHPTALFFRELTKRAVPMHRSFYITILVGNSYVLQNQLY